MAIPIKDRPIAYVDVETTGLNPSVHEIIEVAVVFDAAVAERLRLPHLRVQDDYAYFASKVKPVRLSVSEPRALEVNGYTPEGWMTAPPIEDVVGILGTLLEGSVCCGHNVGFDVNFLQHALRQSGSTVIIDYHKLDTVTIAYEHLVPRGLEKLNLTAIREFLGWSTVGAHSALQDAIDARRLYKLWTDPVSKPSLQSKSRGPTTATSYWNSLWDRSR